MSESNPDIDACESIRSFLVTNQKYQLPIKYYNPTYTQSQRLALCTIYAAINTNADGIDVDEDTVHAFGGKIHADLIEYASTIVEQGCGEVCAANPEIQQIYDIGMTQVTIHIAEVKTIMRRLLDESITAKSILTSPIYETHEEYKKYHNHITDMKGQSVPVKTTSDAMCPNPSCGARSATYEEVQTRSADEELTSHFTCQECFTRWSGDNR